ncbi:hypothetical protein OGZ01_32270 [Vibrio harveyi]|nr:hypothetical protein [Vibrio harveyi]
MVIDEFTHCTSNDDHRQLAKALSRHVENGGLLIIVRRERENIWSLLDSKARIGFTATSGASVFAHRTLESPSEAVVMKLLQKKLKIDTHGFVKAKTNWLLAQTQPIKSHLPQ